MRERKRVTMWRDDHIGDPVGAIFLGIVEDARRRLTDYFGEKIRILSFELVQNRVNLEIECYRFLQESNQLVKSGREVRSKGLLRNAQSLFEEALILDPLNSDALLGRASLLADRKEYPAALAALRRARETGGDRADLLQALARISIQLDHVSLAIGYLQRAAEVAPNDPAIRRALASITPRPANDPRPQPALEAVPRDRRA